VEGRWNAQRFDPLTRGDGKMKPIYLDYNATTPVRAEVLEAMLPYFREAYGNPSSIHRFGQEAKKGIEEAREKVARLIHARPMEIVFTGGGTEADNLAIKGAAYSRRETGNHIITSSVEHHAVETACRFLEKEGFRVTFLPVDRYGTVDPVEVERAIRPETILVTLMHSNNEVGTIQPIEEISKITRARGILFHTDAIQSLGKVPVDVERLGVDLLSLSGHKLYGPKGWGALSKDGRDPPASDAWRTSGDEPEGRDRECIRHRGPGKICRACSCRAGRNPETSQRDERRVLGKGAGTDRSRAPQRPSERRLPNTLNVTFEFVEGESMVISLDLCGIAASTGSACTSGASEASHVLLAMGVPSDIARGSLRFSLGRETTPEEIDRTVEGLIETVTRLRSMSPLYADAMKKSPVK